MNAQATSEGAPVVLLDSAVLDFLLMELVAENTASLLPASAAGFGKPDAPVRHGSVPAPLWQRPRKPQHLHTTSENDQGTEALTTETLALARVEEAGFYVGERLGPRVPRVGALAGNPVSELDALKVLCRDLWRTVFGKQVDSLKTNHRGVYVIFDASFRWLRHVQELPESVGAPSWYCVFPAGLIRGFLAQLGHPCTVQGVCEPAPPSAVFTVRMRSSSAPDSETVASEPRQT
jgi:hypothetical protein